MFTTTIKSQAKKTAVLIDDDTQIVEKLSSFLSQFGYSVHGYNKGEDMMKEYKVIKPDIVIIDLVLLNDSEHYSSGLEILYRLCKLKNRPAMVLISGYDMNPSQMQLWRFIQLTYDRVEFLAKPFGYNDLQEVLEKIDKYENEIIRT